MKYSSYVITAKMLPATSFLGNRYAFRFNGNLRYVSAYEFDRAVNDYLQFLSKNNIFVFPQTIGETKDYTVIFCNLIPAPPGGFEIYGLGGSHLRQIKNGKRLALYSNVDLEWREDSEEGPFSGALHNVIYAIK